MRDWEGFRRFWAVFGLIFLTGALLALFIAWPVFLVDPNDPEPWAIVWMVASTVAVMAGATWPKKQKEPDGET